MADDKPITVDRSAIWTMLASFARDMIKVAGAGLVTRGIANEDAIDQAAGLIVAIAPIAWSQLHALWNHRKMVRMATILPDAVATVTK